MNHLQAQQTTSKHSALFFAIAPPPIVLALNYTALHVAGSQLRLHDGLY